MKLSNKAKTRLISTVAVAGAFSLLVGNLNGADIWASSKPVEVSAENLEDVNDWYTINADDETKTLDLLFSPNPKDFKSISRSTLESFKNSLIEGVKLILASQIDFSEEIDLGDPRIVDAGITDQEDKRVDVLKGLINGVLLDDDEINPVEFGYYQDSMEGGVDKDIINSDGNFLRSVLALVSATGYDTEDKDAIIEKIGQKLGVTLSSGEPVVNESGEIAQTLKNIYVLDGCSDQEAGEKAVADIVKIYNDAVEIAQDKNIEALTVAHIFSSMEETVIPTSTLVGIVGEEEVKNSVIDILTNTDLAPEVAISYFNKLSNHSVDDICNAVMFTETEVKDVIGAMTNERLIEIVNGLTDDGLANLKIILKAAQDNPIKSFVRGGGLDGSSDFASDLVKIVIDRMSIRDLISAISEVNLDGFTVYTADESGKSVKTHALLDWLNTLPRFQQIRNLADNEMHWNTAIQVKTALTSDPVVLNLNWGFQDKDCKWIRKLAGIIDDTIDLSFGFDHVDLTVKAPTALSNIYGWLCDSGFIKEDNKLKNELFDIAFASIGEIRDYIKGKEIEDIISMLKDLDYEFALETVLSAEELSDILGVSGITQSQIDKLVDLFARAVHKAAEYDYDDILNMIANSIDARVADVLDNEKLRDIADVMFKILRKVDSEQISVDMLLDITNEGIASYIEKLSSKESLYVKARDLVVKVLDAIPSQYQDNSLMDLYKGNGKFAGEGTFNIPWEKVITKLPKGDKLYDIFSALVSPDERPSEMHVSVDFEMKDTYSVTYKYEDTVKRGMLHKGSDVRYFANINEIDDRRIVHWMDETNNEVVYDEMPEKDIVVVPELLYTVETSEDIDKEYDGDGEISVTPVADRTYTFTYQWQKLDDETGEFVDVDGETADTLSVPNVDDSGAYQCVVNNGEDEVISAIINVNITPAEIDLSGVALAQDTFDYTGDEITAELDPATLPEHVTLKEATGNKATASGDYQATFTFETENTNYVFKDDTDSVTLDWTIDKMEVTIASVEWDYVDPLTFNGETQTVQISKVLDADGNDITSLFSVTYTNDATYKNAAVEPGTYKAQAKLAINSANADSYKLVGEDTFELDSWVINKLAVTVASISWNYTTPFIYAKNLTRTVKVNKVLDTEGDDITYLFDAEYTNVSSASNAGTYQAHAQLSVKSEYVSGVDVSGTLTSDLVWKINKAQIDVSNARWDYDENNPFTYDGQAHTVTLINVPTGVSVSYANNSKTEVGNYTAVATLTPEDANNYELIGTMPGTLSWKIVEGPVELYSHFETESQDGKVYGKVDLDNGIGENPTLCVEVGNGSMFEGLDFDLTEMLGEEGEIKVAYSFSFKLNNADYNLTNEGLYLQVLIPEEMKNGELHLVFADKSGNVSEVTDYIVDGNYAKFHVNNLGKVGFAKANKKDSLADHPETIVAFGAMGAAQIALVILTIAIVSKMFKKPKNGKED